MSLGFCLGRSSGGLRRLRPRLESVEERSSSSRQSTSGLQRNRCSTRSILAESELVPHIVESVQIGADQTSEFSHPFSNDTPGSDVGQHKLLEPSCLTTVIKGFLSDKASDDTISIIKKGHADSSLRKYQSIWGKFLDFLDANTISHDGRLQKLVEGSCGQSGL